LEGKEGVFAGLRMPPRNSGEDVDCPTYSQKNLPSHAGSTIKKGRETAPHFGMQIKGKKPVEPAFLLFRLMEEGLRRPTPTKMVSRTGAGEFGRKSG